MGNIKELLENTTTIGEIADLKSNGHAHQGIREMAQHRDVPVRHIAQLAIAEVACAHDVEGVATQFAPGIKAWIEGIGIDMVLVPHFARQPRQQQTAIRAVTLAAMRAATEQERGICVLVPHGPDEAQGSWAVDAPLDDLSTDAEYATSYTRHQIHPGILITTPAEHYFATASGE